MKRGSKKIPVEIPAEVPGEERKPSLLTKNWREYLKKYEINSKNFNSQTFMIIESSPKCFPMTDALGLEMDRIDQSRVRSITQENLEKLANGEVPTNNLGEVGMMMKKAESEAKNEMLEKNILSTEFTALLIKLQMLIIRSRYLSHKENYYELQRLLEEEQQIFLQFEDENAKKVVKGGKTPKEKPKKENAKKGKGVDNKQEGPDSDALNQLINIPSVEIKKTMAVLNQNENFIEPFEGVDLYFAISKVYDYNLLNELINIGVNLTAVIDFAKHATKFSTEFYHITPFECSSQEQVRYINISNFWRACGLHTGNQLFLFPPTICYLRYCPNISKEISPGDVNEVYHDLVRISYNVTALKRLHRNYLDSINLLDVEMKEAPKKLRQMKVYKKILDRVPNEFQSIPVILHALVEEIASRSGEDKEKNYELDHDPPPKLIKRHEGAREQVKKLFKQFRTIHRPLKNLNTKVTVYKTKLIQYGNVLEYQLSHVPYSGDLRAINLDALKTIEPLRLFDLHPPIQHEREMVYNYSFYKWANNFEYTPVNRLKYCIDAYYMAHGKFFQTPAFLDVPKYTVSDIFFSDYKPYNQNFENTPVVYPNYLLSPRSDPTKSTKFKAAEIQRDILYCEYIEEYNIETMIQIVNIAYNNLKNFEYKFLNAQDTMLLRFRQIPPEVQHQYYSIRTPVCFRDFCGYIVDLEVDWLYGEEFEYWEKKLKEMELKNGVSIEDVYVFEEDDFIRPGSIKDRLFKEKEAEEATLSKKLKKASKTDKGLVKGKRESKSKKDLMIQKDDQLEDVPVKDKPKVYEGYNLGDAYFLLRCLDIEYQSIDGIKVSVDKRQFIDDSETCSIKVNVNDNYLLFHTTIKESLMEMKPLTFQLHISNETIMTFSPPRLPKHVDFLREKCLGMYAYKNPVRRECFEDFFYTQSKNHEEVLKDMTTPEHKLKKQDVLMKIKQVVENRVPIFKICSSPLHKRRYVKRIKSHIETPVGKLLKRLVYKPKPLRRLKRKFTIPPQTEPYSHLHTLDFDFKSTLPTGLCIHAVQGTKEQSFYIRQGYVIDRSDLESIDYEDYRCFLKGKVVSFLKTGEVITMSLDRVLEKRQYGVPSSNLSETMLKRDEIARKKSRHSLMIHKATKNISRMEKKIKRVCKRREKHMIDFSWNYRLESRRECLRNKGKIFKLPKKLFQMAPGYFPLLKLTMITEDGSKVVSDAKNMFEEKNKYFTTTYNDYLKRETLMYRQDGTSSFLSNDGKVTTQFKDKTRITSWASLLNENYIFISDDFEEGDDLDAVESLDFNTAYSYDNMEEDGEFWRSSDNSSCLSGKFEVSEFEEEIESFVVYGMNYKYEHPNYMTVTEFCTDESTTIEMPDKVKVKISKDGSFTVTLQEEEMMEVNKEIIKLFARTCQECKSFTTLDVHIKPFYQPMPVKSQGAFLQMLDKHRKLIKIDFSGHLTEEEFKEDSVFSICTCPKQLTDRYFVLKRDLSGAELFPRPVKPKFIHTKNFFPDNPEYNPTDENPISVIHSLYKTYTEHLMMLYDIPLLGMTNNYLDSEELFRSFDYDEKCIIPLRNSIFTYERNISRLFLHKVLDSILSGVYAILHYGQPNKKYRPSRALTRFIKDHTPIIEVPQKIPIQPPAPPPKKPYTSKFKTLKKAIEESKKLLDYPVPKFFDSLRGIVIGYIIECVSKAMDASEKRQLEEATRRKMDVKKKKSGHLKFPPSGDDFADSVASLINYSASRSKSVCIQDICDDVCSTKIDQKIDTKSEDGESNKPPVRELMPAFCTPSICCPSKPSSTKISLHSFASINTQDFVIANNEKIIALDIIKALIKSSAEKDLSDLSNSFIQTIVKEKTKDFDMNYENAVTIINEMETLLFQNAENNETVFHLAVDIINHVKDEIINFKPVSSQEQELNVQLIEDLTVRGSIMTYDALSTMSNSRRISAVHEITDMLQEAKLSQGTATIVLDLIEQGLQEDLEDPQVQTKDSLLDQISEVTSETALKIICNAEDIMVYQKIEMGIAHFSVTHPKTNEDKSFPSLGSGDFLYAGCPIGDKPLKRKHMEHLTQKNIEEIEEATSITLYPIIEKSSSQPVDDKKKGGKRNVKRVKRRKQVSLKEEQLRRYSMKNFQKKLYKEQSIIKQPFHFASSMEILEEENLQIPHTTPPLKSEVHRFAERKRLLD